MKNTVVIIAHNEEENIEYCIESILNQSIIPDRIILIDHKSNDNTIKIAEKFKGLEIYKLNEGDAPIFARIEAFKYLSKEDGNIFCIDGDAVADKNWIKELGKVLEDNILAGSFVFFRGNMFEMLSNISNYFNCIKGDSTRWIWGASFAFHSKDVSFVIEVLNKVLILKEKLKLSRYAEDYFLALYFKQKGNIRITNKTKVSVISKENSIIKSIKRNRENLKNGDLIRNYFNSL